MRRFTLAFAWLWLLVGVNGCAADQDGGAGDDDGSSDTDTDTDTDTDSDSDTDSDTDTGPDGPPIPETCEDAAETLTSVGCEFYVADMDNWDDPFDISPDADPLDYSVVVSNPQEEQDATIEIEDGYGEVLVGMTLVPGQLQVIDVACETDCLVPPAQVNIQGLGPRSGFRLTADVPVTAYQWNPYGAEIFTTDSSLLIPVTSLSGTYIVASWQTSTDTADMNTSQVMIVGTADGTALTITPAADVDEHGGIGPLTAGVESAPFIIDATDVLTIRANGEHVDLTGTVIQADQTVVVFGGNSCGNVPTGNTYYCDHVEEQLLPLEAWGTETVLARHAPKADCTAAEDEVVWRVIAGADNMTVSFDPAAPSPVGAAHHFDQQGEYVTFLGTGDHYASGLLDDPPDEEEPEAPFFAYQLMTGATHAACGPQWDEGDPMMLLSPPAGQYLNRYVFNTDNVFDFDYDQIIVVRPAGVAVELDCLGALDDAEFSAVGGSDWEVGRFFIDDPQNSNSCVDGAHFISAAETFGLSVVGTASYQSYGYLGGVGVRSINPSPVIE
jgi:hypothetical protein